MHTHTNIYIKFLFITKWIRKLAKKISFNHCSEQSSQSDLGAAKKSQHWSSDLVLKAGRDVLSCLKLSLKKWLPPRFSEVFEEARRGGRIFRLPPTQSYTVTILDCGAFVQRVNRGTAALLCHHDVHCKLYTVCTLAADGATPFGVSSAPNRARERRRKRAERLTVCHRTLRV